MGSTFAPLSRYKQVRELEQKLDLERSSARRHESQIHRLRNQLERMQDEQREDVSNKSGDALKRMQKQLRDLRLELQEAERREQDQIKKRRQTVSKVVGCLKLTRPRQGVIQDFLLGGGELF